MSIHLGKNIVLDRNINEEKIDAIIDKNCSKNNIFQEERKIIKATIDSLIEILNVSLED